MDDVNEQIWRFDRLAPQVFRVTRTPTLFTSLDEVREAFLGLRRRLSELPIDRARHALLIDLREGPLRSDPAFDAVVSEHRPLVFEGFHVGAVLVRTMSGKIQLTRHERADRAYRVFDDEAEVLAFLRDSLDGL